MTSWITPRGETMSEENRENEVPVRTVQVPTHVVTTSNPWDGFSVVLIVATCCLLVLHWAGVI